MTPKIVAFFIVLILHSINCTCQQVCNGQLAKPIVDITFGAGANPGPALPPGTTNYAYSGLDCPPDGGYTIRNTSLNCFYGDWHTLTQDHTGDPNGYFMLVNAAYGAGDFFVDTIKGLCSNVTYEFAAWILEIDRPGACATTGLLLPNITFSVEKTDGTLLQTYNTGDIAANDTTVWNKYGFFFNTAENTIVLRIRNNTGGGCGNDLALDDITFSSCNPVVSTSLLVDQSQQNTYFCYGADTSVNFNAVVSGGYGNLEYQWQTSSDFGNTWGDVKGATDSSYVKEYLPGTQPGVYLNRVVVAPQPDIDIPACQIISDSSAVTVAPLPVPGIATNSPVCNNSTLTLTASGGQYYFWGGPSGFTSNNETAEIPQAAAKNAGSYMLQVTSQYGCIAKDSAIVTVNPSPGAVTSPTVSICEGTATTLSGTGNGLLKWSPSAGLSNDTIPNPIASPIDTTTYLLTVTNAYNCFDTASVTVDILKKPVANAGPSLQMTQGQSILLQGSAAGYDVSWYWTPDTNMDNPQLLMPTISPLESITYTLHVTSNARCGTDTSTVYVLVYKKIEVPNAFSPNGDGINDTWVITALQTYASASLSVFNRNGQIVFTCTGYNKPWDGTFNGRPLPVATYYYVIDLKNGTPLKSGNVTIIR